MARRSKRSAAPSPRRGEGEDGAHEEVEDLLRPVVRRAEAEREEGKRPFQAVSQLEQVLAQSEADVVFRSQRRRSKTEAGERAHGAGSSARPESGEGSAAACGSAGPATNEVSRGSVSRSSIANCRSKEVLSSSVALRTSRRVLPNVLATAGS